jgi:two-component system nitrate/nitrite response regulator NarL
MSEPAQEGIKILLVDDHALFREGVARLLGAEADFEVVGACGSVEDALQALKQKSIDIVLLDFYLGERDGKDFLRLAREQGLRRKDVACHGRSASMRGSRSDPCWCLWDFSET